MRAKPVMVKATIYARCVREQAVRSVTIAADEAIMTVLHAVAQDVLNGDE